MNATGFKNGDWVEWASSSNGTTKTKIGVVVAIVPARTAPASLVRADAILQREHSTAFGFGCARDHESYLVSVPTKSGRGRAKIYWPRVKALQLAKQSIELTATPLGEAVKGGSQ